MIRNKGLSREILRSMIAVTMTAAMVVFFGSYIAFTVLFAYFPALIDTETLLPTGTDLAVLAVFTLIALAAAVVFALKLTARILVPLNSVAENARLIAEGNLTARATTGDASLGEAAHLVDDFNVMAQRLEDMSRNMVDWNAAIAHELRTPLTILRGRLQGIEDHVFEPDEALIRGLLQQVEGLSRLVDDLRAVTLVNSGRLELKRETVSLGVVVKEVADLLRSSLADSGFSIETTVFDIEAHVDPVRLRQCLIALVDNAQRHAKPGRIRITTLSLQGVALLQVEDDGPGLPPEFVERAFQPFARVDAASSRRSVGSGLGLSIVKAIAEAHGGKALYQRSSQGGSVFQIELPLDLKCQPLAFA